MDKKCELLTQRLSQLDPEELNSFRAYFDECDRRAYDWGLWAAAYIIQGGCSDDSFWDFRSTLISQGREIFELALRDPDSLADQAYVEDEDEAFYEGYAYAVTEAERAVLGENVPPGPPFPDEPSGENWDENDEERLAQRFPKLSRKFG